MKASPFCRWTIVRKLRLPRYLARAAGLEILLPPREWLGNPWRESRHADLVDWLTQTAPRADAVIVAIDTLAYGGLIPRAPRPRRRRT